MASPNNLPIIVCAYSGDPFVAAMKMETAPPTKPEHHEKWFLVLSKFFGDLLDQINQSIDRPFYTSLGASKWVYGVMRLYATPFAHYIIVNGFMNDGLNSQEAKDFADDIYQECEKEQRMDILTTVMVFETPSDDPSIVRITVDMNQIV